jgi:hypothetical protein
VLRKLIYGINFYSANHSSLLITEITNNDITINLRQMNGVQFIDLLNNLPFGEITPSQIEILCKGRRIVLTREFEDCASLRVFPTIKLIIEYNTKVNELAKSCRTFTVYKK